LILGLPFLLGIIDAPPWAFGELASDWEAALAFVIFLQITAALFNLLPIPPLDGFNAISPYLPPQVVQQARAWGMLLFFLLFYAFLSTPLGDVFISTVANLTDLLGIPREWIIAGLDRFRFWQ
jgi:Zn-dependent protease